MENKEILEKIEEKLTGSIEKDFDIILSEAKHFQSLGLNDLVNDIMRLLNKHYGEEGKKYLLKKLSENVETRKKMYFDVLDFEKKRDYQHAQDLIVKLIDTFPIDRPIKENQVLMSFNNLFENMYFASTYNKEKKEIIRLEEPYANYYFHLGFILFSQGDFEGAIKVLFTSLKYNPVQVDAILLQAECYYNIGDMEKFFENIDQALLDSNNRYHLANAYHLLAKYYLSIGDKKMSQACVMLSKNYLETDDINSIQESVEKLPGESLDFKDVEAIKEVFKNHKTQFGPSTQVLSVLAKALADEKNKANPIVRYYLLSILFDITKDPGIKKQLDELKPEVEKLKNKQSSK